MGTVLNREEKQTFHIHNNKMFVKAALSTLLVCSSQAGWQQHSTRQASKPAGNLVEELAANGASTLIDFAVKAGLADTLTGEGPFTVFAPTNAAFAALPQEIVDAVSADTELLKSVLLYHVVPGNILSSAASNDLTLDTAQGTSLRVNVYSKPHHYGNTITVNSKSVAKIPEATLNGLLADKEALTKVLLRHVAPGAVFAKGVNWGNIATAGGENVCTQVFKTGAVKVSAHSGNSKSSAMVVEADITATNGVIHAIDTVI